MSSHELVPSYRVRRSASGRRFRLRPKSLPKPPAPPVRFRPLQRVTIRGSGTKVAEHPRLDRPPPAGFLNLLASSSAPNLPALFHAGSAHGVHPSELCSFRAAARRLRRRCPLVVGMSFRPVRAAGGRRSAETRAGSAVVPIGRAVETPLAYRALLHTKVRHPVPADWAETQRVALLGFIPSRVFPLTGRARLSPRLPS
jgi:hypothetical protein